MPGIKLQAAAVNLKASKTPRVEIVAYNGGLMTIEGFGPVVLDLAGLEIPDSIPLCVDHDLAVDQTIGNGLARVHAGQSLIVRGSLTRITEAAQHVIELSKIGNQLQASIGADVVESRKIREGQQIQANGRTIVAGKGGFTYITRAVLIETSFVTYGADRTTSVSIAASRVKGSIMSFDEWLTSLGFDELDPPLTDKQRSALMAAWQLETGTDTNPDEQADDAIAKKASATAVMTARRVQANDVIRVGRIREIAADHPRIAAAAIRKGWSIDNTKLRVMEAARRSNVPSGHFRGGDSSGPTVLECSLLQSCGVRPDFLAKQYGEQAVNQSMELKNRGANLHTVINHTLRAAGNHTGWVTVNNGAIAEAFEASRRLQASGVSGGSLPGILGNLAGKLLLNSYSQIASTWQNFCAIQSARNFKPITSYGLVVKGELYDHGRGGKLDSVSLEELSFENKVQRHGAIISLDEQDIIDDDLQTFAAIPDAFGRLAAVGLEKAIYKSLLAALAALFTTDLGNYFEGGSSALSIDSLSTAEQKFLDQVDVNGDPLLLVPKFLAVPTTLSAKSGVLTRDAQLQFPSDIDQAESTGNPHAGKFTPLVSPWLNNDNLPGSSDNHWFLFAPPTTNQGIVQVAFLNGQQSPVIEQGTLNFAQLGVAWRVVFDFGTSPGDHRFGVRSKGSA